MKGTIQSHACDWKVPYKEGKSIIRATFTNEQGDTMNATMTIEGKDDRVTVFLDLEEMPDRKIRVTLDTFEEKR
jgi:predicted methyltransferase